MVRLSETGVTYGAEDSLVKLAKLESVNLYGTDRDGSGGNETRRTDELEGLYLGRWGGWLDGGFAVPRVEDL